MNDLTEKLLDPILLQPSNKLVNERSTIFPRYDGQSVVNIPASICRLLGVPELGERHLVNEIHMEMDQEFDRVVLFVLDGISYFRFRRRITKLQSMAEMDVQKTVLAPLTSVVPSTTSSALTSLWTGRSTRCHGITGYEMWLKEYGIVANMISHSPVVFRKEQDALNLAGFKPEEFLQLPTLGEHLMKHRVNTFAFQRKSIARSGLSKMFMRSVNMYPYRTVVDLVVSLQQLFENHSREKFYSFVYWGDIDGLSHRHGPDDQRVVVEFEMFFELIRRLFINKLSAEARKNTLVLITSDHGHIYTADNPEYDLRHHAALVDMLHLYPTGENRLAHLYPKPDKTEAIKDYFQQTWPGKFTLISRDSAMDIGLYGTGLKHPKLHDRIGDLIAIANEDAYLWWGEKKNTQISRHGGLHKDEMIVPLLGIVL